MTRWYSIVESDFSTQQKGPRHRDEEYGSFTASTRGPMRIAEALGGVRGVLSRYAGQRFGSRLGTNGYSTNASDDRVELRPSTIKQLALDLTVVERAPAVFALDAAKRSPNDWSGYGS